MVIVHLLSLESRVLLLKSLVHKVLICILCRDLRSLPFHLQWRPSRTVPSCSRRTEKKISQFNKQLLRMKLILSYHN